MNYRHSFHAGNFADVLKHAVLTRILAYLQLKPTPFRVIDTHAGSGLYDLHAKDAATTGEWRDGVGRLATANLGEAAEALLVPYRAALKACHPKGNLYPGSPWLIRHFLRENDRGSFNELHERTLIALKRALGRDERLAINLLDGFTAWKAQIPPPERRGLVLVDPPFEAPGEFERLTDGLRLMHKKWPTGTACLWYPIKDRPAVQGFERAGLEMGFSKLLVVELHVDDTASAGPLAACGLMITNPPWSLADELHVLLPPLARLLARDGRGRWRVEWLAQA